MSGKQDQLLDLADEQQLWKAFKQGNQRAYATIYHQQVRVLFSYGSKIVNDRDLVKDSIQDLFYYLWEHRSGLSDTDNIRRYLFTVLRRSLVSQTTQRLVTQRLATQPLDQLSRANAQEVSPSYETQWIEQQTAEEHQQGLQEVLRTLPERQREAVFLKYYQDMSTEEMAAIMNINRRAVYKLLTKAIRNLQQAWPTVMTKIATSWSFCLLYF